MNDVTFIYAPYIPKKSTFYYALPDYIGTLLGMNYFKSDGLGYILNIVRLCDRVWEQQPDGCVKLIKDRRGRQEYDPEEFQSVKICSTYLTHDTYEYIAKKLGVPDEY
jgi:hypothetical protein